MEEMIRRYQEEAMRYREQGERLYREQMPAQEMNQQVEEPIAQSGEPPRVSWCGEAKGELPSNQTEIVQQEPESVESIPEDIQGAGDVSYLPEPVPIEELLREENSPPNTEPYTDQGELQVEASAASRSLAIDLADVLVLGMVEGKEELVRYLQTNNSGNTPVITLPAPSRSLSEQPEPSGVRPYGIYTVVVNHPDYYTTIIRDVQIFAGQRSLLPVNLIPLSEKLINPSAPNNNINTDPHQLNE